MSNYQWFHVRMSTLVYTTVLIVGLGFIWCLSHTHCAAQTPSIAPIHDLRDPRSVLMLSLIRCRCIHIDLASCSLTLTLAVAGLTPYYRIRIYNET